MKNNSDAPHSALVLFSGGQDSSVCLAWALEHYDRIETIGFDYGQRHRIELTQRLILLDEIRKAYPDWGAKLGPDHLISALGLAEIGGTALTEEMAIETAANGLPNTFVPARNLVFLSLAAALAYRRDLAILVGGMCETDFSGYPDCRRETLDATAHALSLGLAQHCDIQTPLMWIDKAETWALGQALGGTQLTDIIVEHSHTCYLGERGARHEWGYGCGSCPSCKLRADGHARWQEMTATP